MRLFREFRDDRFALTTLQNPNIEVRYIHTGNYGWLAGVVVGQDVTEKLQVDAEFYAVGTLHPSGGRQTLEGGLR
jgi:hypothetical protein